MKYRLSFLFENKDGRRLAVNDIHIDYHEEDIENIVYRASQFGAVKIIIEVLKWLKNVLNIIATGKERTENGATSTTEISIG